MSELPTSEALQRAWDDLREIHTEYLQRHGVKIPDTGQYRRFAKSIWLAVLHYYQNKSVHKDTISDICQRDQPKLGRDQQVRHLKRDGWKLTGARGYHRLDPYQPSPEWVNEMARQRGRIEAETFAEVKQLYGIDALPVARAQAGRIAATGRTSSFCNRAIWSQQSPQFGKISFCSASFAIARIAEIMCLTIKAGCGP